MSGLNVRPVHRVKGRAALLKRLRALLLACHRFARHRAVTPTDRDWAITVLDHLTATVQAADPGSLTTSAPDTRRTP